MTNLLQRSKFFLTSLAAKVCQGKGPPEFLKGKPLPSSVADVLTAKHTIEGILEKIILPFWSSQCLDVNYGGYRSYHRLEGGWNGPRPRHLVAQARTLWFFSRLTGSPWELSEHQAAAHHGFRFLHDVMWDRHDGGFFWEIEAMGPNPRKSNKNIYGQAFGLYALSEYVRAFNNSTARKLAQHLFSLLETHARHTRFGGYAESCTRSWEPIPIKNSSSPNTSVFIKTMNTHLHLLEAFTTYYRISYDPVAKDRLIELMFILSHAIFNKNLGASTDKYFPDWTTVLGKNQEQVSYGHDLELIWLLSEACDALGIPKETLFDLFQTIFDYADQFGVDHAAGGVFERGYFNRQAHIRRKLWWVQAEALLSFLHLAHLMKKEQYWNRFAQTLEWINSHQIDGSHEDWHRSVESNGIPTDYWYDAWKAPYHNGRSMLECLKILNRFSE